MFCGWGEGFGDDEEEVEEGEEDYDGAEEKSGFEA